MAVGLAGGWILLTRLSPRPTVALLIVLLILAPGIRLSPNLPVIFGDEVLIFAVGGLLLLNVGTGRQMVRPKLPLTGLLLVLFIPLTALSMLSGMLGFDIVPSKGGMFEFVKIAKYALAFYIASRVTLRSGDLNFLSNLVIAVIGISAFLGLLQVFNVFGIREFFGEVYFAAYHKSGEIDGNTLSAITHRMAGTIGNPNHLGMLIGIGVIFGLSRLTGRGPRLGGLILPLNATTLLIGTLLLTGSRTAVVASVVAGGYVLATSLWSVTVNRRSPAFVRVLRLGVFVLPAVLAIWILNVGEIGPVTNRLSRFMNSGVQSVSVQKRIEMVEIGLQQASESLALGYGPAEGTGNLIHSRGLDNEYMLVVLRYGFLGLLLFAAFWYSAFRFARSCQGLSNPEARGFGQAVAAVVVLDVVAMFAMTSFFDMRRMTLTCLLLGLCVAAHSAFGKKRAATVEGSAPAHG